MRSIFIRTCGKRAARLGFLAVCFGLLCILLLPVGALHANPGALALPPGLVFWNRFESQQNVTASEVGPGLLLTSYKFADWQEALIVPAQFGNGLYVNHDINEGWRNDGGNFFALDMTQVPVTPERGAVEFWFKFKYAAGTRNHAYFFDTRNAFMAHYPNQNWSTDATLTAGWNGWDYAPRRQDHSAHAGSACRRLDDAEAAGSRSRSAPYPR